VPLINGCCIVAKFEFETDYAQLLNRDIIEGHVFRENDGVMQEQKTSCGKIIDFLLKYGPRSVGIEVKVWPEQSRFKECLKYRTEMDAVFLAVPQEYAGLAKDYRKKSGVREIGIIGISLNTRSNIIEKASLLNPVLGFKNTALQRFYCDFHKKKEADILKWLWVPEKHARKIKQAHAEILEEFFKKKVLRYTYPLIALYITARAYSPFKFLSAQDIVDKNQAVQKFYWKSKIAEPRLDTLKSLGFIESYQYGIEKPHSYYMLSDACYLQIQFMEKKIDEHAKKIGFSGADALVADVQNWVLNNQHNYESAVFQQP